MIRIEHVEAGNGEVAGDSPGADASGTAEEEAGTGPPIGVVRLDRPDRRNALTPEMLEELGSGVERLAGEGARCVVLAGEGKVFCAGFDLGLCADDPGGGTMRALLEGLSRAVEVMRGLEVPVVVAAHGAAIAGGCALLGGADVVVSNPDAKVGYPVAKIGVSPAVSAPYLGADLPPGVARRLMLEPELISGEAAARLGLVHELAADRERVFDRAMELAARLAGLARPGAGATKRWLVELAGAGIGASPERGLAVSASLAGGEEERAMLAAALGGRR